MDSEQYLDCLGVTENDIQRAESKHYFVDFVTIDKPTWYRSYWQTEEEVRATCLHYSFTRDHERLRIWRESDLSTVVTYKGQEMTLRELFFGGMYQDGHINHLVKHFHVEGKKLPL